MEELVSMGLRDADGVADAAEGVVAAVGAKGAMVKRLRELGRGGFRLQGREIVFFAVCHRTRRFSIPCGIF